MKLFAKFLLASFSLCLILSGALQALARQSTTPQRVAIFLPDSACAAPCWQGINTNETSHAATVEKILALPHAQSVGLIEWTFSAEGKNRIRLEDGRDLYLSPQGLRLGDIISALGWAKQQSQGHAYDETQRIGYQYLQFFYEDYRLVVTVLLPFGNERLRASTPVRQLIYLARPFEPPANAHPWQGFVWMQNYPAFGFSPSIRVK